MASSKKNVHVLMIPYPAAGHILPSLDLAHQLAIRGITITILLTPKNIHYLDPLLSIHKNSQSIQTLVFPFPSHPSLPQGVENLQDIIVRSAPDLSDALSKLQDPIFEWFKTSPAATSSPPVAVIADELFSVWTIPLCDRLHVKLIAYVSVNVHTRHYWLNHIEDSAPYYQKMMVWFKKSWGVIFNSFVELGGEHIDGIKKMMENENNERVWGVGPLVPIKAGSERGGSSSISADELIGWLDSCQVDRSVVYIGFGTQITLNKHQMEALATALEQSEVRFIWAVKAARNGEDQDQSVLPNGFEDRVAGRGIVVKGWAPQAAILEHRAVGAYLTHCGWNSVLEALRGGVILLAWPMQIDHFHNTKLFADELGAAVRVCEGLEAVPDSDKLTRILTDSVSVDSPERIKLMELREKALKAIEEGGSSTKALDAIVEDLFNL